MLEPPGCLVSPPATWDLSLPSDWELIQQGAEFFYAIKNFLLAGSSWHKGDRIKGKGKGIWVL